MVADKKLRFLGFFVIFFLGPAAVFSPFAYGQELALRAQESADQSSLVQKLLGAVVQISATQVFEPAEEEKNSKIFMEPEEGMFQDLLQNFLEQEQILHAVPVVGSGFIVDAKLGLIVTNMHVVAGAKNIQVSFSNGTKLKAEVLGEDVHTDIALLKVDAAKANLQQVQFGDSDQVKIGESVLAIGSPMGLGNSVTAGIISARGRHLHQGSYKDFIQTDAPINRGNSGGPLFNKQGEVIGINTALASPTGGSVGIAFAIPANLAKRIVKELKEHGKVERGWLALRVLPITPAMVETYHLPAQEGAFIAGKIPAQDVDNAALQEGDVILSFNGKKVKQAQDLAAIMNESPVRQLLPIKIWRGGKSEELQMRLTPIDESRLQFIQSAKQNTKLGQNAEMQTLSLIGLSLSPLDKNLRQHYKVKDALEGLIVTRVLLSSPAAQKHLKEGDVIVSVNEQKVKTLEQLAMQLARLRAAGRKNILFLIARHPTVAVDTLSAPMDKKKHAKSTISTVQKTPSGKKEQKEEQPAWQLHLVPLRLE